MRADRSLWRDSASRKGIADADGACIDGRHKLRGALVDHLLCLAVGFMVGESGLLGGDDAGLLAMVNLWKIFHKFIRLNIGPLPLPSRIPRLDGTADGYPLTRAEVQSAFVFVVLGFQRIDFDDPRRAWRSRKRSAQF